MLLLEMLLVPILCLGSLLLFVRLGGLALVHAAYALGSIAFDIPPAEALTLLNQWIATVIQLLTSTGLMALFEFWYKALWRRTQTTQTIAKT